MIMSWSDGAVRVSDGPGVPPTLHKGLDPMETTAPAGYPIACDEAREKPKPKARVAMSPS
jgi:hypothetical protein